MSSPISDEIALRIGLAARALPDTPPARLIRVLADAVGLPPTSEKLGGLRVKDLKSAADGELGDIDADALKAALALLKGEGLDEPDPPPPLESYSDGDMPGSIRVACASNGGEELDGHFGSARRFLIYQVSATDIRLVDIRSTLGAESANDRNSYRVSLIKDCHVVYVVNLGGPAMAKVIKADIHISQHPDGGDARETLKALQGVLAGSPPPWLKKLIA
jgi:nitrogen fixation protein NifX